MFDRMFLVLAVFSCALLAAELLTSWMPRKLALWLIPLVAGCLAWLTHDTLAPQEDFKVLWVGLMGAFYGQQILSRNRSRIA